MPSPFADLAGFIRTPEGRRVVLYKNDDELRFLESWLSSGIPVGTQDDKPHNTMESARDLLAECDRCPSATGRKKPSGSGTNGVMVLLNAPSMLQRSEMDLLRKDSAVLLKNMIGATGLKLEECYLTNLIKCDTTDPIVRPSDMLSNCTDVFRQELERIRPRIVIVMGDIKVIQRTVNESKGINWFTMHHPVTIVKNPELKRSAWNTLRLVMDKLKEE